MGLFGRKKPKISDDAGIVLGYRITDEVFRPVLNEAGKKETGWKIPTFIKNLNVNPAPLLMEEHWYYDKEAFQEALLWLNAHGETGLDKIKYVFTQSKRFKSISVQGLVKDRDDIDYIVDWMQECDNSTFSEAIKPLEEAYGSYAYPNNYQFERMNAGIISALSTKYPTLSPLDDSIRAPVYEHLGTSKYQEISEAEKLVNKIATVTQSNFFPIPKFSEAWNPDEFVRLHKSKGANQLRELVKSLRKQGHITDNKLHGIISEAKELCRSLSTTNEVVWAFGGLGAGFLAVIKTLSNPFLFVPSAVFAYIQADQFFTKLEKRIQKEDFRWLDVATQIAKWKVQGDDMLA